MLSSLKRNLMLFEMKCLAKLYFAANSIGIDKALPVVENIRSEPCEER